MTHKDIYTKFMIEYDKANVTSSYPSLTEYEVATVLDKAYNALIAQKVTGNNVRRVGFEGDLKSVTDLQPLIVKDEFDSVERGVIGLTDVDNTISVKLPDEFLYLVGCKIKKTVPSKLNTESSMGLENEESLPIDSRVFTTPRPTATASRKLNVKLVSHDMADKFKATASNVPWVKNPVCYLENNRLVIVHDSYDLPDRNWCELTYIKQPNRFVKPIHESEKLGLTDNEYAQTRDVTYFDYELYKQGDQDYMGNYNNSAKSKLEDLYNFECNDTVAEELISLAIAFALENVESQRLNSKLNIRGLEA